MKLLIGTKNKDKFNEIRDILSDLDLELISASDIADLPDVVEDRETIEGNAIKKAQEMALHSGLHVLADDTGLFVDALDGAPGVYSARYAGYDCTYKDNRRKLLNEMENIQDRSACFRTVAAFVDDRGELITTAEGEVNGVIIREERGNHGFGYDSIFLCKETDKTFAEMSGDEKHLVSHRGRALRKMMNVIIEISKKQKKLEG